MRLFNGFRSRPWQASPGAEAVDQSDSPPVDPFPPTISADWSSNSIPDTNDNVKNVPYVVPDGRTKWIPYGPSSLASLEEEITALEQYTVDRYEHKYELVQQYEKAEQEINIIKQRVKDLRKLKNSVVEDEAHEVEILNTMQTRINNAVSTRQAIEVQQEEVLAQIQCRQAELHQLQTKYQTLEVEYRLAQEMPEKLQKLIDENNQKIQLFIEEISKREQHVMQHQQKLLQITQEQQHLQDRINMRESEIRVLHAQRKQLRYKAHALQTGKIEQRHNRYIQSERSGNLFEKRFLIVSLMSVLLLILILVLLKK